MLAKKSALDTAANISIIVVCAIAAAALIRNQFFPARPTPPPGSPPSAEKGERFEQLKAVVPAGSQRALVVALSPACHFCDESMTFYKRILNERDQRRSPVKFIAAVAAEDMKIEEAQKLATAGAQPDSLVQLNFGAVKVPGTPTLMLVDNEGKVLDVWVGKLDASRQQEVLNAL
jgi:thioredoxin-related protein